MHAHLRLTPRFKRHRSLRSRLTPFGVPLNSKTLALMSKTYLPPSNPLCAMPSNTNCTARADSKIPKSV